MWDGFSKGGAVPFPDSYNGGLVYYIIATRRLKINISFNIQLQIFSFTFIELINIRPRVNESNNS